MKTVTWCCLIAIILSTGTVSAQVLLRPRAVGSVQHEWAHHYQSITWTHYDYINALQNKWDWYFSPYVSWHTIGDGVIEFSIAFTTGGAPFPLPDMTTFNWIAMLTGLEVEYASNEGGRCRILLEDLKDSTEDGIITADDWMGNENIISRILETVPSSGQIIDPVDVTQALRNDLFGSGTGGITSGFYLKTDGLNGTISYNRYLPRIVLSFFPTFTPRPPPTVTPTPTPSPTPEPTNNPYVPVVRIWMPSDHFVRDQLTTCSVFFRNPSGPLHDVPLFVILDVHGQIFFAPEFNDFSCYLVDVPVQDGSIYVLDPFLWPESCGSAEGIRWYAALTDLSMTTVISNIDTFSFGWSE